MKAHTLYLLLANIVTDGSLAERQEMRQHPKVSGVMS